jgi:glycosyltransferase involved in cell wall biosynthesis
LKRQDIKIFDLLKCYGEKMMRKLSPSQKPSNFCHINNDDIKISVILNYYSKESTVYTALEKLSNQFLSLCSSEEIEIIIIDDGTEGEELCKKLPNNITYLWQRKFGYGISRAKNTGAKIANGKYLVFLDPDILVCEPYIDAVLSGFYKYGDRVVQCGYIWDYHFKGCPDPRTEFGVWENPDCLTRRFYQLAGGNMAISKSLFMETEGFDEDLIYGGVEDLLFGYHISLLSTVTVFFNKEMESWHIPHPPSLAHANPQKSWDVVKIKYPDFYDQYIVRGLR